MHTLRESVLIKCNGKNLTDVLVIKTKTIENLFKHTFRNCLTSKIDAMLKETHGEDLFCSL